MRSAAAIVLIAACSNALPPGGDTGDLAVRPDLAKSGRVPMNHRPDDSACGSVRPSGDVDCTQQQSSGGECNSDAQCMSGANGRCNALGTGVAVCLCTYDSCSMDADCAAGQLCACHGSAYAGGDGNSCTASNCRVDGDCPGSYCSPSASTNTCGSLDGYFCHVADDECVDDRDCSMSNSPQICMWSSSNRRWQCVQEQLCA